MLMQRQMKGHWAGTVRKLRIQWSVKGLHIFNKTQPKWTIWPPPISLSSSLWAAPNSMFTPLPGTASFLPAPTLCAAFLQFLLHNHSGTRTQLLYKQCSWLLQTTEALLMYSLQALGQPWFKGLLSARRLLPLTVCLAPVLEVADCSWSRHTWTSCVDLCLSS